MKIEKLFLLGIAVLGIGNLAFAEELEFNSESLEVSVPSVEINAVGPNDPAPLNGTVCRGKKVYYEYVSHAGGATIAPGGVRAHSEVWKDGRLLERIDYHIDDGLDRIAKYSVEFDESTRVEKGSGGSHSRGYNLYSIKLKLLKNLTTGPKLLREETVNCRKDHALLP